MEQLKKCPKCGSAEIGEGELDGHATLNTYDYISRG
jgi:predicted nucleic-acid-binding Zn-ribbon protein